MIVKGEGEVLAVVSGRLQRIPRADVTRGCVLNNLSVDSYRKPPFGPTIK